MKVIGVIVALVLLGVGVSAFAGVNNQNTQASSSQPLVTTSPQVQESQPADDSEEPDTSTSTSEATVDTSDTSDSDTNSCNPNYSGCLPNVGDLNCADIGHQVTVTGTDVYHLDRDGDGIGCESY